MKFTSFGIKSIFSQGLFLFKLEDLFGNRTLAKIIPLFFFFLVSFGSKSQSLIQDQNGNALFLYDTLSKSLLEFPNYSPVRFYSTNGQIKDGNQVVTCTYNIQTGEFKDLNNHIIGKLQSDGSVLDINGDQIGTIQAAGQIFSVSGSLMYTFSPGVPLSILAYQFFLGGF